LPTEDQLYDMSTGGTNVHAVMDLSPTGPFANYIDGLNRIGKDGTTLYVSFLFKVNAAGELMSSRTVQSSWRFRKGTTGGSWGIGQPWGGGTINFQSTVLMPQLDRKTHFIIFKIEYKAGNDTVTVWLDPLLGGDEAGYTPTATAALDASFDHLFFLGQGNNFSYLPSQ